MGPLMRDLSIRPPFLDLVVLERVGVEGAEPDGEDFFATKLRWSIVRCEKQLGDVYTFGFFPIGDFLEDGLGLALVRKDDANHTILTKYRKYQRIS